MQENNFLNYVLRGVHRFTETVETDLSLNNEYKERFVKIMDNLSNEDQNTIYYMIGATAYYIEEVVYNGKNS